MSDFRWGLRTFRDGIEVALVQISGAGRLLVSANGKQWWESRKRTEAWQPFLSQEGATWSSRDLAEEVAGRLALPQKEQ